MMYGGHIGYDVEPEHRGILYAARAYGYHWRTAILDNSSGLPGTVGPYCMLQRRAKPLEFKFVEIDEPAGGYGYVPTRRASSTV